MRVIRLIDILLSILGLFFLFPIILIVGIICYMNTRKPIFIQERAGKDEKPFKLIKFRTMVPGTKSVGTHEVSSDAITWSGSFLRKSKLDELPQLINVLRGDMSIVGYRPSLLSQTLVIKHRAAKGVSSHKPGMTGLAQIRKVDMSTPYELASLDAIMVEKMSLMLYFLLILATIFGRGFGDSASD